MRGEASIWSDCIIFFVGKAYFLLDSETIDPSAPIFIAMM